MFTRIADWNNPNYESVRKRTLGFQKVRTFDNSASGKPDQAKIKNLIGKSYPAEVEGSDAKSIDIIGTRRLSYRLYNETEWIEIKVCK